MASSGSGVSRRHLRLICYRHKELRHAGYREQEADGPSVRVSQSLQAAPRNLGLLEGGGEGRRT
jgi:hypothetical protein